MKKFFAILLIITMIGLFTIPAIAGPDGDSYGNVKKVDAGVIKIDAVKDEAAWANALAVPINRLYPDWENTSRAGATGMVYILWSDKGIYVFAEINDTTPTHTPFELRNNPWGAHYLTDSFEAFMDFGNTGAVENIQHSKVDIDGLGYVTFTTDWMAMIGGDAAPYMEYAGRLDGNTYYVEMLIIPAGGALKAGDQVGMQFQINDVTDPSMENADDRIVMLSPNNKNSESWTTDIHNYIVLSAEAANTPPTAEPDAPPADVPADVVPPADEPAPVTSAPAAPKVGDSAMIYILIAALALGSAAMAKKSFSKMS